MLLIASERPKATCTVKFAELVQRTQSRPLFPFLGSGFPLESPFKPKRVPFLFLGYSLGLALALVLSPKP